MALSGFGFLRAMLNGREKACLAFNMIFCAIAWRAQAFSAAASKRSVIQQVARDHQEYD